MTTDSRMLLTPQIILGGTTESPPAVPSRRLRLGRRHLWLIPGLAIAVYANAYAGGHGIGLVSLLLFGIVPHLRPFWGSANPTAAGRWRPVLYHSST